MSRRLAIALAVLATTAWLLALGATSHARARATPDDPLASTPATAARPTPTTLHLCVDGPGFAAAAAPGADLSARARLAFALLRTAEDDGATPALPQRIGADLPRKPPPTCADVALPR